MDKSLDWSRILIGEKDHGFTLIELLIVIVILGLLMSLVAPAMFSKVDSTKEKTARAQMQMIETALDTYRLDMGDYPTQLKDLVQSDSVGWDGPYMPKKFPVTPGGMPMIMCRRGLVGRRFNF
jgi:general secretion pathway protein G